MLFYNDVTVVGKGTEMNKENEAIPKVVVMCGLDTMKFKVDLPVYESVEVGKAYAMTVDYATFQGNNYLKLVDLTPKK